MMQIVQARLPSTLVKEINALVKTGRYTNKSDVIRDAIRKLAVESQIGTIPDTGDSVKEVRAIRKKLSGQVKSFDDIEKINRL